MVSSSAGFGPRLQRINPAETSLLACRATFLPKTPATDRGSRGDRLGLGRPFDMPQSSTHRRPRWSNRRRAAVAGIGLGAALALTPLVWAETPPGTIPTPAPATTGLQPQQSFAPLVKRVLPAVVNISVTETAKPDQMSDQLPQEYRNAPFDDMLRRFFDQQQGEDQPFSHRFGDDGDTKRIA